MNRKCQHHLGLTRLPAGSVGALLLLAAALAGCQRQEVRVYQIPKEVAEQTLTIDSAGAHAADHPPMTSPAMSPAAAAPTEAAAGQPDWTVPQGWVAETPGPMVLATFGIAGGGKPAKVAVSVFPGDVGGTFANINRWRGQLGLAQITEAELPQHIRTLDLKDSKAILADMKGTDARTGQPARLVVAIVPRSGQSWFYKLTGDEQTVAREQEAFVKFVSTAQYPNGR